MIEHTTAMLNSTKKHNPPHWKKSFWSCPTVSLILLLLLRNSEIGNAFGSRPSLLLPALRKTSPQVVRPTLFQGWKQTKSTAVVAAATAVEDDDTIEEEYDGATTTTTTATKSRTMQVELKTEVSNSFLQYSLSIILGRALPDARDGLKPVHRRILYSMYQLNLYANSPHRKCARVVGDVLGKLHPHGDQAVYDALVRMAQHFNSHYPLIDGHGNFGSIDADPAAAMRYTECRLTTLAQDSLLDELKLGSIVDFLPNFDGTEQEPSVLPSKLPFLLLNGSSGIAVGMATNIPPHNLHEILTACIAFLSARQANENSENDSENDSVVVVSDQELLEMVPAPDFPTGGIIMGRSGAKELFTTGNGGIVMRAKTVLEKIRHKSTGSSAMSKERNAIIVTELPYQVNKAALLEKIAALVNDKKLEGIADLRDESDRDGIRVVIELKRDAVAAVVLNNLYKKTPLQTSFSGNFVSLMKNQQPSSETATTTNTNLVPQRFTLRESLDYFLDFRFETLRRKSSIQFNNAMARRHIVEGLLLALEKVDDVVDVIRSTSNTDDTTQALQELLGGASKEQIQAVLKLQLGQLSRLNKDKLQNEEDDLVATCEQLQTLLTNSSAVYETIKTELTQLRKKYGTPRQSIIQTEDAGDLADIDLIKNSRSVIVVTRGGYIKRIELKEFESQGRGTRGKRSTSGSSSTDNEIAHCFTCNDHDTVLMVTQNGIAYSLLAYQIPKASRIARGAPIPSVLPVTVDDVITAVLPIVSEFIQQDYYLVVTTKLGLIKRTPLKQFSGITSRGLIVATLQPDDELLGCDMCTKDDTILVGSTMGKALRFRAEQVSPTGRMSQGCRAMKLGPGDSIADVNVLKHQDATAATNDDATTASLSVLALTSGGYGKRMLVTEFKEMNRAGAGVFATKFKIEGDSMRCLRVVHEDDEILVTTAKGIIVRLQASKISVQRRISNGVMVQKLDEGDEISSVSLVPKHDE